VERLAAEALRAREAIIYAAESPKPIAASSTRDVDVTGSAIAVGSRDVDATGSSIAVGGSPATKPPPPERPGPLPAETTGVHGFEDPSTPRPPTTRTVGKEAMTAGATAAAVVALGVAILVAMSWNREPTKQAADTRRATAPSAETSLPSVSASPTASEPAVPDAQSAAPSIEASTTPHLSSPPSNRRPAQPPRRDCDPPYSIDEHGFRVPKPHCLK
jgi:hypothetical protein